MCFKISHKENRCRLTKGLKRKFIKQGILFTLYLVPKIHPYIRTWQYTA